MAHAKAENRGLRLYVGHLLSREVEKMSDEKYTTRMPIMVTAKMKAEVQAAASGLGLGIGAFVRMIVASYLEQKRREGIIFQDGFQDAINAMQNAYGDIELK